MSNEINEQQNKNINEIETEKKLAQDENMNLVNEAYKKFDKIKYINEELNKFKDDVLLMLKERDKIYLDRLNNYKSKTEKIKNDFDSTNKITNSKFSKMIASQAEMMSRIDQLNSYESFVLKTNDKLTSHEVRINNLREDFSNATKKYDKIYLDNLELPGFIGHCAKYRNCQAFFLDVIQDLAKLNKYREKSIIDLKMYKEKLETIISSMNSILDNNNASQIKYINEAKEKILDDCNKMFELSRENMKEIRVDNSKYAIDLITQSMELSKKWDKIEKIRDDLLEKFNYNINKYQMMTEDTIKSFEEFKNEYGIIRRKFIELAEFIKDVRFRKNIGENVKKKEIKEMVKKILKKRRSYEKNNNIQLLNDISNIENIDYKKYYQVENNNNEEENDENRSNSLRINKNNTRNEKKNKNEYINKKKHKSVSKEILYKKDLNQSTEDSQLKRISLKNPLTTNSNVIEDYSNKSISISPINIQNFRSNKTNEIIYNKNNSERNKNINKFKSDFIVKDKKNDNLKNIKKDNKEGKNIIINEKSFNNNIIEKKIDTKNNIKNNEINKNPNNNKQNEINNVKNNIISTSDSLNINEEKSSSKYNMTEKEINLIENQKQIQIKQQAINDKNINRIEYDNESTEKTENILINNNENRIISNNPNNIDKNLIIAQNHNKNIEKDYEISQKSLSKIMNQTELKTNVIDDSSSISPCEISNTNSVKKLINNNNIGLSSEKSLSFISENNNLNKFLINEKLENNDKIIKELASELEQSTAKKDILQSNKKEIEQNFKNTCINIEPIRLLGKKEINIKMGPVLNNVNNNANPKIDNIENEKKFTNNINQNISRSEFESQNINDDNISIDKNINKDEFIDKKDNNDETNSNIKEYNSRIENETNSSINNNEFIDKKIINDKNINRKIINNINNNELKRQNNNNINYFGNKSQINNNNDKKNNNNKTNELKQTITTEEDNNYDINSVNYKNLNELINKKMIIDDNNNINNNNKSVNESINSSLNPIKLNNNEIYINESYNPSNINKKFHAVDQKLLNLELYTKEKILDLISQINLLKQSYILPCNNSNSNLNKISNIPNKSQHISRHKTFSNCLMSSQNINHQNPFFYYEKNKENINENTQNILNNVSIDKKRFSLLEASSKSTLLNSKNQKNNNVSNINSNDNSHNIYLNKIKKNNNLTDNYNGNFKNNFRTGNMKDITDGNNSKIIQNINIEGTIKDERLKNSNSNNEDLNYGSSRSNNTFNNSSFNGVDIKLVDLNKLVNHQLPRNRLYPINIIQNDYFVPLNSK